MDNRFRQQLKIRAAQADPRYKQQDGSWGNTLAAIIILLAALVLLADALFGGK